MNMTAAGGVADVVFVVAAVAEVDKDVLMKQMDCMALPCSIDWVDLMLHYLLLVEMLLAVAKMLTDTEEEMAHKNHTNP